MIIPREIPDRAPSLRTIGSKLASSGCSCVDIMYCFSDKVVFIGDS